MPDLKPRNMSAIKQKYPELYDALIDIVNSHNNVAQQVSAAPVGVIETPEPHSAISVLGGGGIIDVALTDNSPKYRGKENFFDYSNDGGNTWHTKSMGPSRNWRGSLGNGTFIVRSYTQHSTSGPSEMIYHDPVDVTSGGQPPMQANQGSGTETAGYGQIPFTGPKPPIR